VKSLRVKARMSKGLVETSFVWKFADSARRWKPEVEFTYDAPRRGVVTFFAYWFNGERVVARVVEKGRARAIYNTLSRWGVDPALIENEGGNRFRARIFPVFQGQDVQVEMHMVAPLDANLDGWRWSLPLESGEKLKKPLAPSLRLARGPENTQKALPAYEKLDIEIDTRGLGDPLSKLRSSLPLRERNGVWRYRATNVSPGEDFALAVQRTPRPMQADLHAARANSRGGYFALSLALPPRFRRPQFRIEGMRTRGVFPSKLEGNTKGRGNLILGRYERAGRAVLVVKDGFSGEVLRKSVIFSAQRSANGGAAKLWAARAIAALGTSERNRARVVALSQRWSLPSPHTAWLAVPKSERENLNRTRAEADLGALAREVASDVMLGQNRTRAARARGRATNSSGRRHSTKAEETYPGALTGTSRGRCGAWAKNWRGRTRWRGSRPGLTRTV
jgi:hypothetical protein